MSETVRQREVSKNVTPSLAFILRLGYSGSARRRTFMFAAYPHLTPIQTTKPVTVGMPGCGLAENALDGTHTALARRGMR